MAKTAKETALETLGPLDLSYLDSERQSAQNTYNTGSQSLQSNFDSLLGQIESNKADNTKNFNTGRTTVAENAFTQNKQNQADLASRGVSSGGLMQLGELGNRIETGKQYSNLANEYYDTLDELNTTQKQGQNQYDIDKQNLSNTLNQSLAGIDSRGAEAQNAYNMSIGQLAEQIQGRWDANANAQAALAAQKAATAAAQKAASTQQAANDRVTLLEIANKVGSTPNYTYQDAAADIGVRFGVDNQTALNVLTQIGLPLSTSPSSSALTGSGLGSLNFGSLKNYNSDIDYITNMLGG